MKMNEPADLKALKRAIGEGIRRYRKRRGLTQARLAATLEMEPRTLQRIERGERCSLESFARLARALEVEPWRILKPPPRR